MKSLRYLNTMLTILAVLLTLQLWTTWTGSPNLIDRADAAIPDAGAQRQQIVDQLKALNARTEELKRMFLTGKAKVTVQRAAEEDQGD